MASAADALAGRAKRAARATARIEWFDQQLKAGVTKTMKQRVAFAGQALRDQIVVNISLPVKKVRKKIRNPKEGGQKSRTAVDPESRSKKGEFPRADTTRLMKDIFTTSTRGGLGAQVGTTLDYGLFLEVFMDRSFIKKTFDEMKPHLKKILGTNYKARFR